MNKILTFIFMFLLFSCIVSATDNLIAKYTFDTGNLTYVYDDSGLGHYLRLQNNYGVSLESGIIGNGAYFNNSLTARNYTGTSEDFSQTSITINFWIKNTHNTNQENYVIFGDAVKYRISDSSVYKNFVTTKTTNSSLRYSNSTYNSTPMNDWHMLTFVYDKNAMTGKTYIDGQYNSVVVLTEYFNYTSFFSIGTFFNSTIDEITVWDIALNDDAIYNLYTNFEPSNTITVSTPLIAIDSLNTKFENGILYVYPSMEGQTLIKGYYYIDNNFEPVYQTKICDLNTSVNMIDNFNSVTYLSDDGWSYAGNMTTGIFDAVDFGLSLWFNTTLYISDIYKSFTPTKSNLEVSYILKPQGLNVGASFDKSTDTFISVRSVAGGDITPIEFAYNGTVTGGNMCLYSYAPTRQLILCQSMGDDQWLNVTEYIDFKTSKTYTIKVSVNNIPATTKYSRPINFFSNEQDIGRIYIHPQFNASVGTSMPNQFIDDIAVINIGNTYAPLVLSNTTNITYTTSAWCFLGLCKYFYTTQQNYGNHSFSAECDYSVPKCYTSRFYTYNTNASVYNNYEDFTVCSVTSIEQVGNVIEGNPSTYNPNGVNIDGLPNISSTTKLLIVFFTVLFTIIGFITAGFTSHQEQLLIVTGLVFAVFELLIATIFKWIPSWIGITLLIVALFFMVIVGFLFKGNQGAG